MDDKVSVAVERLKTASDMSLRLYKKPLVLTYSGGKDSDAILKLAEISGIPFICNHALTTVDAPETVWHVYKQFRRLEEAGVKCVVDKHVQKDGSLMTMWKLVVKNLSPPTRWRRYCCSVLKEASTGNSFIITGVRWDESTKRKNRGAWEILGKRQQGKLVLANDNDDNRRLFETCSLKSKRVVNPIIDWTDDDVYNFCAAESVQLNPLYCRGFDRVGCIGCPLASYRKRQTQFAAYPKYKAQWIRTFDKMIARRRELGKREWPDITNGRECFEWWMQDPRLIPGQVNFFEDYQEGLDDTDD